MRKSFLSYLRRKVGLDVNIKDWGNGVWEISAPTTKDCLGRAIAEFKKQNPQLHIEHVIPCAHNSTGAYLEGVILITR